MYENLSVVYDRLMDVDYNAYKKIINQELENFNNPLILDLGCGSGAFLKFLSSYGKTYGIDNSEEMLSLASEKNPMAKLFLLDILNLKTLNINFDFIISTFDVFNYLRNFEEFSKGLKEVYDSLNKEGKFIFDIHTPYKIENMLKKEVYAYDDEDISYIWFTSSTNNELEVESDLVFFLRNNKGYKKLEQYHIQRTYYIEKIIEEIKSIGFNINTFFCDFDKNNKNYNESERIIFILEK